MGPYRATSARTLVGSINAGLYPYVNQDTRSDWETFSMKNMGWINRSHAFEEDFYRKHGLSHSGYQSQDQQHDHDHDHDGRRLEHDQDLPPSPNVSWTGTDGASPQLFRYGRREGEGYLVVEDSPGPYYPRWHLSPIREYTETYINYNANDACLGHAYTSALESVRETQSTVFGGVWNVDDEGYILEDDDYDTRTVPAAAVLYPIFDTVIGGENRTVVAVLEFDLEFGPYFQRILPPSSNSVLCVVSNPCGQTFSYEVNGESVAYRGPFGASENEDVIRQDLVRTALLTDFDLKATRGGAYYSGVPINEEHCPWTLSIYPTNDLEAECVTNAPLYYALAVAGVFLLACFGFVILQVARRQHFGSGN